MGTAQLAHEYRVFGPPGTGKTRWLARQCVLAAQRFDADDIFAVSFTKAAATEMAGRETGIPATNIGTIHSLCYRSLDHPRIVETCHDELAEWNARHGGHWPITGDVRLDDLPLGDATDEALRTWNRDRSLLHRQPTMPDFATAWEAFKKDHDVVDYTDLLLSAPPTIGAKVLLVDECQDLTPLQWRIVRQWACDTEVFCAVGDDDQTIYEWLGTRPDEFLSPLPEEQTLTLTKSYRLPRHIHAHVTAWIRRRLGRRRRDKAFEPRDEDGEVAWRNLLYKAGEGIAREIRDRAADGRTVMVLATCGFMLRPTIRALRDAGLAYHNPYRRMRGDWNPLRPDGVCRRLLAFLRLSRAMREMDAAVLTIRDLWRDVASVIRSEGNLRLGAKAALSRAPDTLENWLVNTSDWFMPATLTAIERGDLEWLGANVMGRVAETISFPLRIIQRGGHEALRERPKIIVGTIHSVKGGEADDVFLFPDLSWAAERCRRLSPGGADDALVRLFYVGMTRARRALFLCRPSLKWSMDLCGNGR